MLKNDIRYIIKRVLVGVLIAVIIFLLKSNHVLAANVSISSSDFQYSTHYCSLQEVNCSDFYVSGYSSFGTWKTLASQTTIGGIYFVNSYARSYASMTTGNTYTYTFRQQFDPKNDTILKNIDKWQYDIFGYANNTLSDSYIATQSCSTRNVPTHTYAVETTCSFTLNTNVSYVLVRTAFTTTKTGSRFTISNAQMQSAQSEVGAINELNATIKAQFARLIANLSYSTEDIVNAINSQQEYLEDDTDPTIDVSDMSNITGILPAGPIDSLLALPLNVLNILINACSGTCTNLTIPFVFGETLTLPCFDIFYNEIPSSLTLFTNDLPAVLIFILWAKSVYKRVERATTFESSVDDEWGGI